MLTMMLDFRFIRLNSITTYVDCENVTNLVANYKSQLLLPLLVEAYESFMPNAIDKPQVS
jgi:hypothetical protein